MHKNEAEMFQEGKLITYSPVFQNQTDGVLSDFILLGIFFCKEFGMQHRFYKNSYLFTECGCIVLLFLES